MAIGDAATWVATIIAFCSGVAGMVFGVLGYRQAKRTAARDEESWFVDWTPSWDGAEARLVLVNTGSDTAKDTRVTVSAKDQLHHAGLRLGDVAAGAPAVVELPDIDAMRREHDARQRGKLQRFHAAGIAAFPTDFKTTLKVTIGWKTGLGFPKSDELQVEAR